MNHGERNIVISLFDYSGVMLKPWAAAGFNCYCYDIQHPNGFSDGGQGIRNVGFDLKREPDHFDSDRIAFVAAFPPCDHLAVSGARWFKGKGLRKLAQSIELFATAAEFCEQSCAPYMIENPVSTISTYWRKPDHTFHPHQYAGYCANDNYTKKTCLWTGGGFVMPQPSPAVSGAKPDDRIHKCPPGPNRKNIRSATPGGFAQAVYLANRNYFSQEAA